VSADSICHTFELGGTIAALGDVAFVRNEITVSFLLHDVLERAVWHCLLFIQLGAGGPDQTTYRWLREANLAKPFGRITLSQPFLFVEIITVTIHLLSNLSTLLPMSASLPMTTMFLRQRRLPRTWTRSHSVTSNFRNLPCVLRWIPWPHLTTCGWRGEKPFSLCRILRQFPYRHPFAWPS